MGDSLTSANSKSVELKSFTSVLFFFAGRTETTHFSTRKHLSAITRILIPPKEGGGGGVLLGIIGGGMPRGSLNPDLISDNSFSPPVFRPGIGRKQDIIT